MKDEELTIRTPVPVNDDISLSPPIPYNLLVRQSKKLGTVAIGPLRNIKHMLHHETNFLPQTKELLGNLPHTVMAKTRAKELAEAAELKKVVRKSHEVLASARTVFPITLFPGSLIVDRTKVSIIKRDFFWTANVISFQIEDILNVSSAVGPLFGSLTIASRVMSTVDHFHINYLWRGDAIFLKHLIQGYVIAKNNKLETGKLTKKEMVDTLCELGADSDR